MPKNIEKNCSTCGSWEPGDSDTDDLGGCRGKIPTLADDTGRVITILTPADYWCRSWQAAKSPVDNRALRDLVERSLPESREEAESVGSTGILGRVRAAAPGEYDDLTLYRLRPILEELVGYGVAVKEKAARSHIFFRRPAEYSGPPPSGAGKKGKGPARSKAARIQRIILARCVSTPEQARTATHQYEIVRDNDGITRHQFYAGRRALVADGRLKQTAEGKYWRPGPHPGWPEDDDEAGDTGGESPDPADELPPDLPSE